MEVLRRQYQKTTGTPAAAGKIIIGGYDVTNVLDPSTTTCSHVSSWRTKVTKQVKQLALNGGEGEGKAKMIANEAAREAGKIWKQAKGGLR